MPSTGSGPWYESGLVGVAGLVVAVVALFIGDNLLGWGADSNRQNSAPTITTQQPISTETTISTTEASEVQDPDSTSRADAPTKETPPGTTPDQTIPSEPDRSGVLIIDTFFTDSSPADPKYNHHVYGTMAGDPAFCFVMSYKTTYDGWFGVNDTHALERDQLEPATGEVVGQLNGSAGFRTGGVEHFYSEWCMAIPEDTSGLYVDAVLYDQETGEILDHAFQSYAVAVGDLFPEPVA